jgi:rfaE bifunctional protein kinase chain/domain
MNRHTKKSIKGIFNKMSSLKVFVVGDAMLDKYWYGEIERISPEAPIPVVSIQRKDVRLGGAANVAMNCAAMGAEVYLLTTTGKDPDGQKMISLLNEHGINAAFCLQSKERITTAKTRVIAKNQQVLRIDEEHTTDLSIKDEHHFIDVCLRAIQIEKPDVLIFEDYNKGLLTENMIAKIITHCQHVGVMTAVDPKLKNFFAYREVDLFKPNLKEIKEALKKDISVISKQTLKALHKSLFEKLQHQTSLITLSEKGIYVQNKQDAYLIPSHIRQIADVSGAGDTVIAVASLIYFLSKDIWLAAQIANLAGGLVCEQSGVVSVDKALLLAETSEKLLTADPVA